MISKTYIGIGRSAGPGSGAHYFWWLTTASGQQLYNSKHFPSKRACERAIAEMKRELGTAPVMDVCAHEFPVRRTLAMAA